MTRSQALTAAAVLGALLATSPPAFAGPNPSFTLPLHAVIASTGTCSGYLPVDCSSTRPNVSVPPDTEILVFVFVADYNDVGGVQTAFAWDPGWQLLESAWNCQPGQLSARVPEEPGGATAGAIATAFTCVSGPALAPIGRMWFLTGASGCLRHVAPAYPFLIHVTDCSGHGRDIIEGQAEVDCATGRICVGEGGQDACQRCYGAVAPATWGRIKASYE